MTPADILLANRLADAAGQAIRPFFRSAFTHEPKADASPVTEADRAAESAIRDTDFAEETANLTRSQILASAATTVLAQANASPQAALGLLRL